MMSVPSFVTFFLRVDSKMAPFILHIVEGVGTPTLLHDKEMFSFHGVTMLRLNDVILAGTAITLMLNFTIATNGNIFYVVVILTCEL